MNLIEVKNLSYSYDGKTNVLDDVSFVVGAGKYISIIGHNGSGKSTIAKLLTCLLEPKSGSIIAFGLEANRKNAREIRSHTGIVFQNPDNQFIGSTVRDDIAFGLENRQVKHEDMEGIIQEFAEKVNMSEYLDKEPENLSGGQKQRVAIAGILAMKPDLVIFDEATSMLDPKGRSEIHETIKKMREENPNLTLISITHDLEEAFASDSLIVLNKGKVMFEGYPKEVLKHKKELEEIGLDLPFKNKFVSLLNEKGLSISDDESLEGIVGKICR